MSDTTPSTSSDSASCRAASGTCCKGNVSSCCTGNPSDCPCAARLAKVERTVCRIRFWLFVSLGVLILLIGIALGRGGAMKEIRERMGNRGPAPMAAPMPPQRGPMMGGEPRGPRDDRRGPRGGRGPDGGPGPRQGPGGPPDMN